MKLRLVSGIVWSAAKSTAPSAFRIHDGLGRIRICKETP